MSAASGLGRRLAALRLAPDGRPRPGAPFGRGPAAARLLRLAIRGASAVSVLLPAETVHHLAVAGGTAEWAVRPGKRRALAANLAHALGRPPDDPAVGEAVRREFVNEAHRSADFLWSVRRLEEVVATTPLAGLDHILAGLADGRGVILTSLHLGGWEIVPAAACNAIPAPVSVIVRDDCIGWAVDDIRERNGMGVVYDSEPVLGALRTLREGGALLVLGDDGRGQTRLYPVRLCDAVAELPAGVATLSRLSGAPILPFHVLPLGPRRWRITIEPPIPAPSRRTGEEGERRALQALADRWSETLRTFPEYWNAVFPIPWRAAEETER